MDLIYEIKLLNKNQIEDVINLEKKLLHKENAKEYILYEANENPVSYFYVACNKNTILGYIEFWITYDSATISTFAVDLPYQNNHVGTTLLKEMFKQLIRQNIKYVTLEVRTSNAQAINLYKKFNFKIETIKKNYYKDGEDAYYMVSEVDYVKNYFSN